MVHSWHEIGRAVRYRLIYWIKGDNCGLPPFHFCDGGDIYGGFGTGYIQDP
jgi:hypothetical protein